MLPESAVICVDTSDYMRNGDFEPTRLDAQYEAVKFIFRAKTRSHRENNVALLTLSRPKVLATLTTDARHFLSKLEEMKPDGCIDFVKALRIAKLVLQNRLDKVHQMRIVAFVGSPVTSDKKELLSLAIKLKRENVKVDIVSFGENDLNIPTLTPFLSILIGGGYAGSHMVSVEAGNVLWRVLMNSPIVRAQDDTPFTYRINSLDFDLEDDDPELALVLRVSMEEHRQIEARRAMANAANGAALAPSSDGAGAMPAEEELLEHMSSGTGQGGAFTGMQHYEATTEDDDLAVAVEMLLSLGSAEVPAQYLPDAVAAEEEPLETNESKEPPKKAEAAAAAKYDSAFEDPAFFSSFLESLPDPGSESDAACNAVGDTILEDQNKGADTAAEVPAQYLPDAVAAEEEPVETNESKEPPKKAEPTAAAAKYDSAFQDPAFFSSLPESLPDPGSESDAACNAVGDTILEDQNKGADTGEDENTPDKDKLTKRE
ncbi:26S proteasome non-ATPase regulatory subunit 4-like isoform X4 [Amblyomma americanum]